MWQKPCCGSVTPGQKLTVELHCPPQDLPPLLLAHIFSSYLSWEDVQASVSLVCQAWHRVAAEVTPQQLNFEFDLVEGDSSGADAAPAKGKTLLQLLLSQPSKLLQRLTGQLRPAVPEEDEQQQQQQQGSGDGTDALDQAQQQQFLQYLQNAPWERWLQQHGMQVHDFAVSITNLDSNCAAAQCQLKETLLKALSQSAAPRTPALSTSSSFASSSSDMPSVSDSGSEASSSSSTSAPDTPLSSSSCSEFSTDSCSSTTTTTTSSLQLKSLHLKVPLFECDVLLLAHGICARAPQLKSLSLVGYSTSGAVKNRPSTALRAGKISKHRLPATRPVSHTGSSSLSLVAQAAAAAAPGASGIPRGGDLIPVGHSSTLGSQPPWTPSPSTGRGGFITGSSLKQLMGSAPQLESLTFACRQLYKLNWLAPATQLTLLSLRDCSLGGDLVKQLAALNLPKLRAVDLSGSKGLGGATAEQHLQQLTRIARGRLEQIDISGWDLGNAGGASWELPHLGSLQALVELKMECCGLRGCCVPAGQLPNLTHLSLSGNPLDSQGVAAACTLTQLRQLDLAHVAPREVALLPQQQPGGGAGCWAGMRAMPHLTSLNLAANFW